MPLEPRWMIYALLLPAVAAAVLALVTGQPWRPRNPRNPSRKQNQDTVIDEDGRLQRASLMRVTLAWALALLIPWAWGAFVTIGPSSWKPMTSEKWLVLTALAAVGVEALVFTVRIPWLGWILRPMLWTTTAALVLRPMMKYEWSVPVSVAWVIGFVLVLLVWVLHTMSLGKRVGRILTIILAGVALGAGLTVMSSGSVALGKPLLVLGGITLGASAVLMWMQPGLALAGLAPAFAFLYLSQMLDAYFFVNTGDTPSLPLYEVVLLLLAPAAAWVGEIPPVKKLRPWQVTAVRVAAVALVVLIVTLPAMISAMRAASEPSPPPW
ncbi:MAG: hypothetical protein GC164_12815 [Phycisphaera sp.]|nr:hypothetical protein [Phycisphaera sp.]